MKRNKAIPTLIVVLPLCHSVQAATLPLLVPNQGKIFKTVKVDCMAADKACYAACGLSQSAINLVTGNLFRILVWCGQRPPLPAYLFD